MNRDTFENQWNQIKVFVREKWSKLTDEDIRQINGHYEELVAKLQQRYGYTRQAIEDELRRWTPNVASSSSWKREEVGATHHNAEHGSFFKWLALAAIPLLLLLGFLNYRHSDQTGETYTSTPQVVGEEMTLTIESPDDKILSDSIRTGLLANDVLKTKIANLKITSANGVVTLDGVVSSENEKDMIARFIGSIDGVKKIDNKLQVR